MKYPHFSDIFLLDIEKFRFFIRWDFPKECGIWLIIDLATAQGMVEIFVQLQHW